MSKAKLSRVNKGRNSPRGESTGAIFAAGRAYMRKFGLCRHCFRAMAHRGEIPGVKKASW